jgi:hypothetical protein
VIKILSMSLLYCLCLSRFSMMRPQTTHCPRPVLTSKTCLADFFAAVGEYA